MLGHAGLYRVLCDRFLGHPLDILHSLLVRLADVGQPPRRQMHQHDSPDLCLRRAQHRHGRHHLLDAYSQADEARDRLEDQGWRHPHFSAGSLRHHLLHRSPQFPSRMGREHKPYLRLRELGSLVTHRAQCRRHLCLSARYGLVVPENKKGPPREEAHNRRRILVLRQQ